MLLVYEEINENRVYIIEVTDESHDTINSALQSIIKCDIEIKKLPKNESVNIDESYTVLDISDKDNVHSIGNFFIPSEKYVCVEGEVD